MITLHVNKVWVVPESTIGCFLQMKDEMGTKFQFEKMKNLEIDSGNDGATLWLYLIPMNLI